MKLKISKMFCTSLYLILHEIIPIKIPIINPNMTGINKSIDLGIAVPNRLQTEVNGAYVTDMPQSPVKNSPQCRMNRRIKGKSNPC